MDKYMARDIEKKWQEKWSGIDLYKTTEKVSAATKKYILDMFPYPSGATMHVGHLEGYVGTDILTRYYRMRGFSVLHPMGWDAFGLPAENYAIKTGIHPDVSTPKNISIFKGQLTSSGLSYDWAHELDTSSPEYYKWTQWLFIQLYKRGLAYKKLAAANWCPSCETVLANEQVINGRCERCDTEVIQKELNQWFFKITAYADQLILGLEKLDWLPEVKRQQINWIGKSEGHIVKFQMTNDKGQISVFTTRVDTLHGATFVALAPDHPKVIEILNTQKGPEIRKFIDSLGTSKDKTAKDKLGIFTGVTVVNPVNGKSIPVWIVNYVTSDYGTGAIMGVPALDERDREFASKYQIDILEITPDESMEKFGENSTSYHLRDWLISRQRYWGAPIPMVWCEKCDWQPVPESELPVLIPKDVDFRPTGESPIARSQEFQKGVVCPNCQGPARREVDTMDTYVDSSWYFMRYVDPHNPAEFASQIEMNKWLPVDIYVGGGHVVQHLLFARFLWKVLFDLKLIDAKLGDEPFLKLRAPGWILGPDSRKMSKRWGNVITPDDVINKHGADVLRMYEMFMGPFDASKPWSITGVEGIARFLDRLYRLFNETYQMPNPTEDKAIRIMHKLIKRVTEDIETFSFNTAVAAMMEAYNQLVLVDKSLINWQETWEKFVLILAPFAPFLSEELYQRLHSSSKFVSVHQKSWPEFDPKLTADSQITIVVQVNGNMRDRLVVDLDYSKDQSYIEQLARESAKIKNQLNGATVRTIFVPGKIINFVI